MTATISGSYYVVVTNEAGTSMSTQLEVGEKSVAKLVDPNFKDKTKGTTNAATGTPRRNGQ